VSCEGLEMSSWISKKHHDGPQKEKKKTVVRKGCNKAKGGGAKKNRATTPVFKNEGGTFLGSWSPYKLVTEGGRNQLLNPALRDGLGNKPNWGGFSKRKHSSVVLARHKSRKNPKTGKFLGLERGREIDKWAPKKSQ